jgi:transposase
MTLDLLAIDLGKRSFHLYGIDTDGVILSRKVSRPKLAEVVGDLAPTAIAMEACASAHHWGRRWLAAGRVVRLINPRFVKPFVKGSKNVASSFSSPDDRGRRVRPAARRKSLAPGRIGRHRQWRSAPAP